MRYPFNDEPLRMQVEDALTSNKKDKRYKVDVGRDEIPKAEGRFGYDATNPIPVNSTKGAFLYLQRLRTLDGSRFFFKRTGVWEASNNPHPVDEYELVSIDARVKTSLYFDIYHFWRGSKVPDGLYLKDIYSVADGRIGLYKACFWGVDYATDDFPYCIPTMMEHTVMAKLAPEMAKERAKLAQEMIEENLYRFQRLYPMN